MLYINNPSFHAFYYCYFILGLSFNDDEISSTNALMVRKREKKMWQLK